MQQTISSAAAALQERLVAARRELHQHPELSGQEVWTTERIRTWLAEASIPVLPLALETGVVAEIRGAKPGPVVALRADIDALPIQEETGLPFASTIAGRMHACGHDFHTATMLGAALILDQVKADLAGTVRVLFQPAEEVADGAKLLIAAGAMDGVKAVFGAHNKPDLPAGYVGVKAGPLMAATDAMIITIAGKGGHAAIPEACVDPVVAGAALVMALQTAVSRSVSPLDSAVVSVASFQAGSAHNVIPTHATLMGTVRTFRPETRAYVEQLVRRIARDVSAGYGCTAEVAYHAGPPAVINDAAMAEVMRQAALELGLSVVEATPTMGAEDFAEYQQVAPGCYVWLGTGTAENWHHPKFDVDESVLSKGAALFALAAVTALRG